MARTLRPLLLAGILALFVFATLPPSSANHAQYGGGSEIAIVHKGGNEWWVEAHIVGYSKAQVTKVEARDDDTSWTALTLRSWGNWAGSLHIEPGHTVHFRATVVDGSPSSGGLVWSCAFTHPAGQERCGQAYSRGEGVVFFDHVGGDANSVRLRIDPHGGERVSGAYVRVEGTTTWTVMQRGSDTDAGNDWSTIMAVQPGKRVQFEAYQAGGMSDAWRDTSCLFTHPAGVEQCTAAAGPGMLADYTGVAYTQGVVQVMVDSSKQILGMDARIDPTSNADDESAWIPLDNKGSGLWSKAIPVPSGAYVQFRTRATDGSFDVSYNAWQAPTMALKSAAPSSPFTVEFRNIKGGEDWVQANPVTNKPISTFFVREAAPGDSLGYLYTVEPQSWGAWAAPIHIPPGHLVKFEVYGLGGGVQETGWMQWPPTSGGGPPPLPKECALDQATMSCNIRCDAGDNLHMEGHDTLRDGTGWPRIHITCGSVDTYCQANNDCTKDVTTSSGGVGTCYLETSRTTGSCSATTPPPPPPPFAPTFTGVRGNHYWIQANVGPADQIASVQFHAKQGPEWGPWFTMKHESWGGWTYSYYIPDDAIVQIQAVSKGGASALSSCYYWLPPSGQDARTTDCTYTPPPPPPPPPTSGFDATFTAFRGNEWWVQANVAGNNQPVAKVEVRLNDGAFQPLTRQSWGGYAASYHLVQGTVVQMRATAADGQTDLSSCRQWIPASNQDASIVQCDTAPPPPPPGGLNARFSNVKGNNYWAEAVITANGPVYGVLLMMDCDPNKEDADMTYRADWGKWTLGGTFIPPGARVTMYAYGEEGSTSSGGYIWPQGTPTSGCPEGPAWPREGSTLRYELHNDLAGGGQSWQTTAWLNVTFDQLEGSDPGVGYFVGTCTGRTVFRDVDGTETVTHWVTDTTVNPPVMTRTPRPGFQVGGGNMPALLYVDHFGVNSGDCRSDDSADWTVTARGTQTKTMRLLDADGEPRTMTVWHADDYAADSVEDKTIEWETTAGFVLHWERSGRQSGGGSFTGDLVATDAPVG